MPLLTLIAVFGLLSVGAQGVAEQAPIHDKDLQVKEPPPEVAQLQMRIKLLEKRVKTLELMNQQLRKDYGLLNGQSTTFSKRAQARPAQPNYQNSLEQTPKSLQPKPQIPSTWAPFKFNDQQYYNILIDR